MTAVVRIRVDNRTRFKARSVPKEVLKQLERAFTHDNPAVAFLIRIGKPIWGVPRQYKMYSYEGGDFTCLRGLLGEVRDIFDEHGIKYRQKDRRNEGAPVSPFPEYNGPEFRYYQNDGIAAVLRRENCIVRMPTGSGKSLMAMGIAKAVGVNTLIILPTLGLFKQWAQDACEAFGITMKELGVIHGKTRRLKPITITVQATLAARGIDDELNDFFGCIIVDECQKCGAASYVKVVDPFKARYRIGVSADEKRKDRKEFLAYGLFGNVEHEVLRKKLEDEGFIMDVELRVLPTEFTADWYGMPPDDGDDDGNVDNGEEADKREIDFTRLVDEMAADPARNALIMDHAVEEVADRRQVLLLSHRVEHCRFLELRFVKRGVRTGLFLGGNDNQAEFERTRAGIKDESLQVGVGTYGALGIGVNLPAVSVGFATTPIASNDQSVNQVRGRLNRKPKGKNIARLYVVWDQHVYPGHLRKLMSKNPNIKVFHKEKWIPAKEYMKRMRKNR